MQFNPANNIILTILLISVQIEFHVGYCKTIQPAKEFIDKSRHLENFVEFKGDGDQLAVENSKSIVTSSGEQKSSCSNAVVGCGDFGYVTKVLYPVIPVIIAFLIALIWSIIISATKRHIHKIEREKHHEEDEPDLSTSYGYETAGYVDSRSGSKFSHNSIGSISYSRLLKNVLAAIHKVYD